MSQGDRHVMPVQLPEHEATEDCWCEPYVSYTAPNGRKVWDHKRIETVVEGRYFSDEEVGVMWLQTGEE